MDTQRLNSCPPGISRISLSMLSVLWLGACASQSVALSSKLPTGSSSGLPPGQMVHSRNQLRNDASAGQPLVVADENILVTADNAGAEESGLDDTVAVSPKDAASGEEHASPAEANVSAEKDAATGQERKYAAIRAAMLAKVNVLDDPKRPQTALTKPSGGADGQEAAEIHLSRPSSSQANVEVVPEKKSLKLSRKSQLPASRLSPPANDGAGVAKLIARRMQTIKVCYDLARMRDPSLAGKVIISFVVTPSGQVKSPQIKYNELNRRIGGCITRMLRKMELPTLEDKDVTMEYPFIFVP